MAARSGSRKGDAVLVMLGNQVELWHTMLAVIKLGAVIMPTTTAVGPASWPTGSSAATQRFVVLQPGRRRKATRRSRVTTWCSPRAVAGLPIELRGRAGQHPGTSPQDRLLLYFTRARPPTETRGAHAGDLSDRTSVDDVLARTAARRRAPELCIPGWAKHAWTRSSAPVARRGDLVRLQLARFDAGQLLRELVRCEVTSFCAPPTVWRR